MAPFISKYLIDPEADATLADLWNVDPEHARQLESKINELEMVEKHGGEAPVVPQGDYTPFEAVGAVQVTEGYLREVEVAFCNHHLKQRWELHLKDIYSGFWKQINNPSYFKTQSFEAIHENIFGFYVSPEAFNRALHFDEGVDQDTRTW
eukprot:CAMPEP_0170512718 /NCGR_PEP_ID=MMETSP0208-20121228/67006_1 /TAXON_ID=197538 /ORGANISM="Strombidium inclinatum, Strain S3" /LENGTH=149 /DNA_ID=CAMNT_0010796379 /DNA_START=214 /DNA_END=661 /DNA_ORIENTATION=-